VTRGHDRAHRRRIAIGNSGHELMHTCVLGHHMARTSPQQRIRQGVHRVEIGGSQRCNAKHRGCALTGISTVGVSAIGEAPPGTGVEHSDSDVIVDRGVGHREIGAVDHHDVASAGTGDHHWVHDAARHPDPVVLHLLGQPRDGGRSDLMPGERCEGAEHRDLQSGR